MPTKSIDSDVSIGHAPLKVGDIGSWIKIRSMKIAVFVLLMLFVPHLLKAQATTPPSPASKAEQAIPDLFIDESSSSVSFGKAYLTVEPLIHKGQVYVGDYKLTVLPYFTMSEKGVLELEAPDDVMQRILGGTATEFTGKATNNKHGKPKVITGKITPSAKTLGSVTFSAQTDNGPMVFNTSYHFGK